MRSLVLLLLVALSACQSNHPLPATAGWRSAPGDLLVNFSGSFAGRKFQEENLNAISIQGGASYVVAPQHEIGGEIQVTTFDSDQRATFMSGRWSFLLERSQYGRPYGGVHMGLYDYELPEQEDSDVAFGFHFGLRHWMTPGIGLYVEPRFTASASVSETGLFFGIVLRLSPR